jgi:dCMP deaminase
MKTPKFATGGLVVNAAGDSIPALERVNVNRITRHQMFMAMAEAAARRSTCYRRSVGCIIADGRNVLAIGYNGAPAGEDHCIGAGCTKEAGCVRAVHGERNAIQRLEQLGLDLYHNDLTMYVTESPCPDCAQLCIGKVTRVFYVNEYRIKQGIEILLAANIDVYRMTPSGFVVDLRSGDLVEI